MKLVKEIWSKRSLSLVFLTAFFMRIIALNQSLWLDEGITARVMSEYSLREIIADFSPSDFHPPLYYLMLKTWTGTAGISEIALRLPSVLFSLAAGWGVYLIGGGWASALFLFNPLVVYYSQEARMYMFVTFLLTFALYFLIKKTNLLFFNFFLILSIFTFYGSLFLIIPMFLYLIYKKQYKFFLYSSSIFLLSLMIIAPLLYQQFLHSRIALGEVANWGQVLGSATFKNLSLMPLKFSFGRLSFYPKAIYYLISGFWTIIVFALVFKGGLKDKKLLFFLLAPIFAGFLLSFIVPVLQYFRFLYLMPIMSLLLNKALPVKKKLIKTGIAATFAMLSLIYLLSPHFHREDWKSLAHSLPPEETIYMIPSAADALRYYREDISIADLRDVPTIVVSVNRTTIVVSVNRTTDKDNITVIPYASQVHGVKYKPILYAKGFTKEKVENFREIQVEYWTKL